jgi:hypothetical protein
MTFTIKIRTQPGAPMLAEYRCPDHGILERLVERDDKGDPPPSVECCEHDHDEDGEFMCSAIAELTISAPSIKFWSRDPVPIGRASKSDEWDPRALDTRPLAEGKMTRAEWKKWQRGITQERRYQKRLKAGRISKRIQVGGG